MNVRDFAAGFPAMIRTARAARAIRMRGTALLAFAALVACSSASSPPPTAFVRARLGGGNNPSKCNFGSPTAQLQIGAVSGSDGGPTASTGLPAGVSNGSQAGDGVVGMQCSVKTSTGGFAVSVSLSSTATSGGGRFTFSGSVDSTTGGTGISASMGFESTSWSGSNCSIAYTYNQMAIKVQDGPVAKGRIWGHLSCPAMTNNSGTPMIDPLTNVSSPVQCDGEFDFQFQNCEQ
jgi:hypothetical protein